MLDISPASCMILMPLLGCANFCPREPSHARDVHWCAHLLCNSALAGRPRLKTWEVYNRKCGRAYFGGRVQIHVKQAKSSIMPVSLYDDQKKRTFTFTMVQYQVSRRR